MIDELIPHEDDVLVVIYTLNASEPAVVLVEDEKASVVC